MLDEDEKRVWNTAYAAVLTGALSGPQGVQFLRPQDRRPGGARVLDTVSEAASEYANRAVADYKAKAGKYG